MQVFFAAPYFEQQVEEHYSNMILVHCILRMQILNSQSKETSLRLVQQYVVAYELEDVGPKTHLLGAGQTGCILPFL